MTRIISSALLFFIFITSLFYFLIALIIWMFTRPFDINLKILQQYTCFWGAFYTWINPSWRIKVEGREKIVKGRTYVVVQNHLSLLDILVAFNLFFHFKFVSKIEIFRIPLIGWNMSLNRYVKLVRGDTKSVAKMLDTSEERLREGSSVFFFPEGTRSQDGNMKEFKRGAFLLAKEVTVPILPIIVYGTDKALPKYSFDYHGVHKIRIRVLDEISVESFQDKTPEETAAYVREIMMIEFEKLKKEMEADNE